MFSFGFVWSEVIHFHISTEEENGAVQSVNNFLGWVSASSVQWQHELNILCHVQAASMFKCNRQIRIKAACSETVFASRLASTNFHVAAQKPGLVGWAPHILISEHEFSWNTRIMRLVWVVHVKADFLSGGIGNVSNPCKI